MLWCVAGITTRIPILSNRLDANASVHVAQRASQACAAAESLGVSVWDEVVEVADQIAHMTGMKVLERRRFLAQLQ